MKILFSTDREDNYSEYRIDLDYERGRLRAWIYKYVESGDSAGSYLPYRRIGISRNSLREVRLHFREDQIGSPRVYEWSAYTDYKTKAGACERLCYDEAPSGEGAGRVNHVLR